MELSTHAGSSKQSGDNHKKFKFKSNWLKYRFYKPDESDDGNINLKILKGKFGEKTTSQGISQFHIAPRGCKKVMWAVLSLTAVVMLVVHMYYLSLAYSQYETTTELTVVPSRLIAFPAVTICNNNGFKEDVLEPPGGGGDKPRADEYDDYPDYQQLEQNGSSFGHSKEDLIVKAVFDNQLISLDEFTHSVNNVYGNCYTFNKNDNRSTRRSAPGYGLELTLNIESYAYHKSSTYRPANWVGALIKVHQPEIEATVEEGGIPVAPGTLSRLALTKTELTRLGGKYSNCLENNEVKPGTFYNGGYNQAQCENTCLQREVISKCCCYLKTINRDLATFPKSWPPPKDPSLAQLNDWNRCYRERLLPCVDNGTCWKEIWNRYDRNELSCSECKDLCSETLYDVSTASVDWPAPNSMDGLLHEWTMKNPDLVRAFRGHSLDINQESVKQNLLQVQIYYERMTITKVKEVPAIGDFEFVSELGGTLGLWIGWTVLTVFEFVEFLMDIIALRLINKPSK